MQHPTQYPSIQLVTASEVAGDSDFKNVYSELEPLVAQAGEMKAADFDVLDFQNLAKNIFIIDVEENPQRFFYRLFGSEVADRYGKDLSGTYCDEHKDVMGDAYDEYFKVHQLVSKNIGIVKHTGNFGWAEKPYLRFTSLHFPLQGEEGSVVKQVVLMLFKD